VRLESLGFELRHPTAHLAIDVVSRIALGREGGRHLTDDEAEVVLRVAEAFARVGTAQPSDEGVGVTIQAIESGRFDEAGEGIFGIVPHTKLHGWIRRRLEADLGPRGDAYANWLRHTFLGSVCMRVGMLMLRPSDVSRLPT
jgi:hypothetical protein